MPFIWSLFASPAMSVLAGVAGLAILITHGRHRDGKGKVVHARIATAILQSAALYTMAIALVGHWFLKIPLSTSIHAGFGDDRFAWLMLGLSIDLLGRLYSLFDPD